LENLNVSGNILIQPAEVWTEDNFKAVIYRDILRGIAI
jgi:hypothetical protein